MKEKKSLFKFDFTPKTIVAIGIGSAVFVILARFASVPVFTNTTIQTTYPFQALMAALFGPVAAALIGLIGHTLNDFMSYGNAWWSWVIGSGLAGLLYGFATRNFKISEGILTSKDLIYFNVVQVIGNFAIWAGVAPLLDILIYQEPANKVFAQGVISSTSNAITVAILGSLLLKAYAASRTQKGSLKRDED